VATLDEALDGMTHLCATAMTPRDFGPPTRSPRAHFDLLLNQELPGLDACGPEAYLTQESPVGVAFLFGSERYGMANEDVYRCHAALSIPTNPDYGSLNLAAAVQLMAYDWRQALARAGGWGARPPAGVPAHAGRRRAAGRHAGALAAGAGGGWLLEPRRAQEADAAPAAALQPRAAQRRGNPHPAWHRARHAGRGRRQNTRLCAHHV
jgi:tRNA/rRNA methyltransferase